MAGNTFSSEEEEKLVIIRSALAGSITNAQAATQLHLSVRQIQRIKAEIRINGSIAVIHKLKGRESNHKIDNIFKEKVLHTVKDNYADFKPKFASEKLQEKYNIFVNPQTLRRWMDKADLWKIRHKKQISYFSWRPRKEYFGELEQFDGSYHYWLEDRFVDKEGDPIEICLLASIDDATGEITKAVFAEHEGVIPVFTFWKSYVEEIGKPVSIYLDKFSTYKVNHKAAVDNSNLITQFERVTRTLGILIIFANSPQAKGRVERLFQTLQDRLVKELRLARINNPTEGNAFLKEIFIPKFNQQFSIIPAKEGNVHKPIANEEKQRIKHIFSIHQTRQVNNDFTVQFKNYWYQLAEIQPTTVRPQEIVLVETWLDGSIHITLKNHELIHMLLPEKPTKQRTKQPIILTNHKLNWKPSADHPWKKYKFGRG
jgi:hypothetical protein